MYVWYTKKFDGAYMINLSSERPDPKPLSEQKPQFVQEVKEGDEELPLKVLTRLYPAGKKEEEE